VVTVTLIIADVAFLGITERSLRDSSQATLRNVVDSETAAIVRSLDEGLREAKALANALPQVVIERRDVAEMELWLKASTEMFPEFQDGIFVLDAEGNLWADYPPHPDSRNESFARREIFARREYFQASVTQGKGVVSRPYRSDRTGQAVLTFTAPLVDREGRFAGLLCCSTQLSSPGIFHGLALKKIGNTGVLCLREAKGLVLSHPDDSRILQSDPAIAGDYLWDATLRSGAATGLGVDPFGRPALASYKKVPSADWVLSAYQSQEEVYAPIGKAQRYLLFCGLVAIAASLGVGTYLVRRITAPLERLRLEVEGFTRQAENYGGASSSSASTSAPGQKKGKDEVEQLHEAFTEMSDRLAGALRSLSASAEQWKTTFDAVEDSICLLDGENRILSANKATGVLCGTDTGSIVGKHCWEVIHASDAQPSYCLVGRMKDTLRRQSWEIDLADRHLEVTVDPVLDESGRLAGVVHIVRDSTERIRAQGLLRASEERYRALVENVNMGIALIDRDYRVVMANAAQGRLFRGSPSRFIGKHCYLEFGSRTEICPHCPGTVALATGRPAEVETEGVLADGSQFAVRIHAFPIPGPDGGTAGFIELVEDITEKKRLHDERRQLEAKVQHAQKLESLGVLAGGIAHDFNNLLMGMLGNADLALRKLTPESLSKPYIERIEIAASRAAELTNQMLAYSGKGKFLVEPIDLNRLVEEMVQLLQTVISKKATLRIRCSEKHFSIDADASQLRQVVMNLITNASDALGDRDGTISITTGEMEVDRAYLAGSHCDSGTPEGRYVYVEVSDTGSGMDDATRAKIFDPFFTTKFTGRGLGLAAVLGIVRSHRGLIRVYSEPGQGTTFKVLFPEAESAPQDMIIASPDLRKIATGTVLVVDDDEAILEVAKDMLEHEGYRVLLAADGREGLEAVRRYGEAISVVLLDMTMPGLTGEEAFQELRRIRPNLPVILSSGFSEVEIVTRFAGKGLAGFLQKPYRAETLFGKLREVLAV
jgi:PAS domain S-box-containing protein